MSDVIATLTDDNAVQIKCSIKNVYGAKKVFELTWENDGTNDTRYNICDFKRENLSYLTNYTFTVSRLIKLYIYKILLYFHCLNMLYLILGKKANMVAEELIYQSVGHRCKEVAVTSEINCIYA